VYLVAHRGGPIIQISKCPMRIRCGTFYEHEKWYGVLRIMSHCGRDISKLCVSPTIIQRHDSLAEVFVHDKKLMGKAKTERTPPR
jgi:hypothetical protein